MPERARSSPSSPSARATRRRRRRWRPGSQASAGRSTTARSAATASCCTASARSTRRGTPGRSPVHQARPRPADRGRLHGGDDVPAAGRQPGAEGSGAGRAAAPRARLLVDGLSRRHRLHLPRLRRDRVRARGGRARSPLRPRAARDPPRPAAPHLDAARPLELRRAARPAGPADQRRGRGRRGSRARLPAPHTGGVPRGGRQPRAAALRHPRPHRAPRRERIQGIRAIDPADLSESALAHTTADGAALVSVPFLQEFGVTVLSISLVA